MPLRTRVLLALIPTFGFAQAPAITALQNNYSYTLPFSPNYGIAQGSIFIVLGDNLANTSSGLQSTYPLPTKLDAVSIDVTMNNTVTHPYLYYVTPTQVAAILPSATPTGMGTITVTNGALSATAPIQVVPSAFGLLTLNGAGSGPAAAFDSNSNLLSPTNSTSPGAIITLWGSGVGPASGDESVAQIPTNLTNIPIEVDVGGIPATVTYRGRSTYPGVDQINLVVPQNVQPGCWVSVSVSTGAYTSNFATIPVAASGRTCTDAITGYSGAELQTLYNQGAFNIGSIAIGTYTIPPQTISGNPLAAQTWNNAAITFTRYPSEMVFSGAAIAPAASTAVAAAAVSLGSCVVNQLGYIGSPAPTPFSYLDAGPSIVISADTGTQTLTPVNNYYGAPTPVQTLSSAFIPSAGDTFTFKNGLGGAVVGAFTAETTVPPSFVWNEMNTLTSVNRTQGVTVTWKNAAPNSFVQITGMSSANFGAIFLVTSFNCSAPASAGTFTVPPSVTLSLPPTASSAGIVSPAFLAVADYGYPQAFSAPGIAFGTIYGYVINSTSDNVGFVYQ